MKNVEEQLLPIGRGHWDNHIVYALPSANNPDKYFIFEEAGKDEELQPNYIGWLTLFEFEAMLVVIGNEQSRMVGDNGTIRVSIKYVE